MIWIKEKKPETHYIELFQLRKIMKVICGSEQYIPASGNWMDPPLRIIQKMMESSVKIFGRSTRQKMMSCYLQEKNQVLYINTMENHLIAYFRIKTNTQRICDNAAKRSHVAHTLR